MKTITLIIVFCLLWTGTMAQAPRAFKYQAVARSSIGEVLQNKSVSFRISILQGSITGTAVYTELHSKITNVFGLVDLEIGSGGSPTGDFAAINWGGNSFFLKVEMDPSGGSAYQHLGTSQLVSVPYALYARDVQNNNDADADPGNEIQALSLNGSNLSLSRGGGTVALPPGDNWGSQAVITDATLSGNGLTANMLRLAQMGASAGQVPKWTGTTWAAGNDLTGITAPGGSSGHVQFNNAGSLGGDANLFWDNSGKRLGIGTNAPGALLDVDGNAKVNGSMTVTEVNRTATGTANLIPVAYGTVSSSGSILSGSGNFSVNYDSANKNYEITIDGHSFSYAQYTVSVTHIGSGSIGFPSVTSGSGIMNVTFYMSDGTKKAGYFSFLVFKP